MSDLLACGKFTSTHSRLKFYVNFIIKHIAFIHASHSQNISNIPRIGNASSTDFKIPVPWGHIAGKRWGKLNGKPVLAVHGWQDNSCSFDPLAPLLPNHWDLVCIDLPGHGLSSQYQEGHVYYFREYVGAVIRTLNFLNWKQFNFIGHSLGSALGILYACLFPDRINYLVSLDLIKGLTESNYSPKLQKSVRISCIERLKFEQDVQENKSAPIYSMDEAIEKWYLGSDKSVSKESIKRAVNILPDGKVQYNRDRKIVLPITAMTMMSTEQYKVLLKFMKCHFLIIKGKPGAFYESNELYEEVMLLYKQYCKSFKYVEVEGTHHLHLNTPERVSEDIYFHIWYELKFLGFCFMLKLCLKCETMISDGVSYKNTLRDVGLIGRCCSSQIQRIGITPCNELNIPVPWGHLAVKQWGNISGNPVIAVHSIQDNAGTFDKLAALLPKHWNIVCIDLPGHGQTSHFEKGYVYYLWDYVTAILRTYKFFKWDKFDYIGHGGGAEIGFIFASLFPELLNNLVSLDLIKRYTLSAADPKLQNILANCYDAQFELKDKHDQSHTYSVDDAVKEVMKDSGLTTESAKILMKRGCRTLDDGKVRFMLDLRVRLPFPSETVLCTEQLKKLSEFMRCKLLIIKAKNGLVYEKQEVYEEFKQLYQQHCKEVKYVEVEGTHYVHLNDPITVSEHIIQFLEIRNNSKT
uniref:AB hydrolase-1 domain-containing protein n=1 Tax=Strigamia maritima TaxID=126957 RepID=T1IPN3_STRMM